MYFPAIVCKMQKSKTNANFIFEPTIFSICNKLMMRTKNDGVYIWFEIDLSWLRHNNQGNKIVLFHNDAMS